MAAFCAPYDSDAGIIRALADFIDCHALSMGENAYLAFAAPGSSFSLVLTGALTISVALFGYRMMLGEAPGLRGVIIAVLKLAVVLTLATQWPAYRTLVHDVALRGPDEFASTIINAGSLDTSVDTVDRFQQAYAALTQITARPEPAEAETPGEEKDTPQDRRGPPVGHAALILMVSAMAALVSVRIVTAMMLALGPVFAVALLFGATRGFFAGWIRVLAGTALAAIGISVVAAFELAVLEQQIGDFARAMETDQPTITLAADMLGTVLIFAIAMLATAMAGMRAAAGIRFPALLRVPAASGGPPVALARPARAQWQASEMPSRAEAVAAAMRRDAGRSPRPEQSFPVAPSRATAGERGTSVVPPAQPIGRRFRRPAGVPRAATVQRRDTR